MQDLRLAIDRISPLSEAAWAATLVLISSRNVAAGDHLLHAGARASRFFFVRSGLLREYYVDAAGRESTRQFSTEGEFSGSLADLLSADVAAVSIEALADSAILEADWTKLNALTEQHPSLMKLLRHITERLYVRKTRREFEMLTLSAAERYRRFVQQYPGLDSQLHRHQVASYLGITPVHLSRICAAGTTPERSTLA
jgi:CRP-like cAMP-binding protein